MDSNMTTDSLQQWLSSIHQEFNNDGFSGLTHSIYQLSNSYTYDREKYTPQYISIGPFHYGKEQLSEMRKHKVRYVVDFYEKYGENIMKEFMNFIETTEAHIRRCYSTNLHFSSEDFAKIVIADAVFIIELFLKYVELEKYGKTDALLSQPWLSNGVRKDLLLLENQLPYFLLEELYNLLLKATRDNQGNNFYPSFVLVSCHYFESIPIPVGVGKDETSLFRQLSVFFGDHSTKKILERNIKIQHFTDLLRRIVLKDYTPEMGTAMTHLPSGRKLNASGIKFKKIDNPCSLDIKFKKKAEVEIPCFEIRDSTEGIIRNLVMFEQRHYPYQAYISNYVKLMSFLINDERDMEFFVDKGIFLNGLGNEYAVVRMFNKLGQEITELNSCYHEVGMKLNVFYDGFLKRIDGFWTRNWEILKRVYFINIWRSTQTAAAALLLVLTFIQTWNSF